MWQFILICVAPTLLVPFQATYASWNPGVERKDNAHLREKRETPKGISSRWCGLPGRDGRDGRDGVQGPYGPPGQKGEPGDAGRLERIEKMFETLNTQLTEVLQKNVRLQHENFVQKEWPGTDRSPHVKAADSRSNKGTQTHEKTGGAVYTRWGRTSCPGDAKKLYHGVVVGSHYKHTGSGSNYLCLPLNPQWNRTVAGFQSKSYLYGTEFQITDVNSGFQRQNSGGKLQYNHDAQCSVCQTPGRPSHVMIPARLECPAGWTLEYIGFLMSDLHTHQRSEYVCVDQDPDVHPGTSADEDGALFYITEVVCGSLPCPPFAEGFEVTCAVCTK